MSENTLILIATAATILTFVSFAMLIYGFVPEEVEDEDIFGYRLTKRKRLVEENALYAMLLPLIQVFAHHFASLPSIGSFDPERARMNIQEKLIRSGFFGAYTPNEFWGMCCVSGIGTFLVFLFMTGTLAGYPNIPVSIIFAIGGMYLPYMQLDGKISQRLVEIDRRLPYAVDLLVLSMNAGLDFMTAMDRVVTSGLEQRPDDPIMQELGVVLQEMRVGTSRSDALINLCERVRSDYLKSMVGTILQAEKRGTPLAVVLQIQVGTIRNKRTQRVEKAASQAAVKILMPLMFIFASVFVIIIGAMVLKISAQSM